MGRETSPAVDPVEMRVRSEDGTRLHVEVHGPAGAPTIVLSHGWTCSIPFWAPVVRALGGDYRVVLYDQRGHGRSATPDRSGYGTTALADDLCAVLRATVADGERAVLAGHSMGGMTMMATAQRPDFRHRAAAVALVSTGSRALPDASRVVPGAGRLPRLGALAHRALLHAPLPLGPRTPITRALLHYTTMARDADPRMVEVCVRLVHACPPVVRGRWGGVMSRLDLDEGLRAMPAPTTIVHGSVDRLTPIGHARRMAELVPHLREFVEIPGTGHMTPLEAPHRVADVLRELVAAHLARPGRADPQPA